MTDVAKSIKLPQFSGKRENFQMWWTRFTCYAMMYKFIECLKETVEADLPTLEVVGANETQEQTDARKRNSLGMFNFTLAFTTEALMGIVYKARTNEWPSGKAHLVVSMLFKKYKPTDVISRVEMRVQLGRVSMIAAVDNAQDMLFTMRVLESMDLQVKKPMILYVDN